MVQSKKRRNWLGSPAPTPKAMRNDLASARSVFLVGLGRFGTAIALTLEELGVEVLAIDTDVALVNSWADRISHVRVADATQMATLNQLGVVEFDAAVVAIGSGIEASVLSTSALFDIGGPDGGPTIWAKAITQQHGSILERVGADHVVYPERAMGERVAHTISGHVLDYFEIDDGFALTELEAPASMVGKTLSQTNLRQTFGVTVVCVKPAGRSFTYATSDTLVGDGDTLLVAGEVLQCEAFAKATTS
ncbi:MAG: trk system potassium uptake protein TrkA [Acidimicrobiales bacterium]|jgi:trk system potassium uptake protein